MPDELQSITDKVAAIHSENVELEKQKADKELEARAHEEKARECRREYSAIKDRIATNIKAIEGHRVQHHILSEAQRATKAREEAEKQAAENVIKGQEADAKLKELNEKLAALEKAE